MPLIDILRMLFFSLPQVVLNPLMWLVIFLVYNQYKKAADMEQRMFGVTLYTPMKRFMVSLRFGILGGIVGSILMIFVGVNLTTESGIIYIWPLAILLMIINPRYICFSYAGGILSLSYLILGWPVIDVPGVIALVAILHFIESILMWSSGFIQPSPIYMKKEGYGIVGGFSLQKFWPIPVVILLLMTNFTVDPGSSVQMPDWWPLIRRELADNMIFVMFPVAAALGYGDIAITQTPLKRVRSSAIKLAAYSIILLLLAIFATRYTTFLYFAAIFAPLAHEMLILYGKRSEQEGVPIYTSPTRGVRVLAPIPGMVAEKIGLKPGDIIYSINNYLINNHNDLRMALNEYPKFLWIDVLTAEGTQKTFEYNCYPHGLSKLGAIMVPDAEDSESTYVVRELESPLKKYINKLKDKFNR